MFELHLFPARDGDALILTWGSADEPHRMMVDCGRESGWPQIRKEFEEVSGENLGRRPDRRDRQGLGWWEHRDAAPQRRTTQ